GSSVAGAPALRRRVAVRRLDGPHGASPVLGGGLRYNGGTPFGAQTGRRGGAGPVGACLAVRTRPAAFFVSTVLSPTCVRIWKEFPRAELETPSLPRMAPSERLPAP